MPNESVLQELPRLSRVIPKESVENVWPLLHLVMPKESVLHETWAIDVLRPKSNEIKEMMKPKIRMTFFTKLFYKIFLIKSNKDFFH